MIETATWIDFVSIWLWSLFDSSQNVRHIYEKILSLKRITNKEVGVQISKRSVGTIASHLCPQKTVFVCFEIIINPSQSTSRSRNWNISPIAANMSCCLTRCSFFLCKIDHTSYWCIRVEKLAIAFASKDNTVANPRIYLRRNSE